MPLSVGMKVWIGPIIGFYSYELINHTLILTFKPHGHLPPTQIGLFKSKLAGCAFLTQTVCGVEGRLTCYWSKQAGWEILVEPINQLLNLIIHQSVDSLYLFLLFRGNWPLSFKLFNEISPSFISLFFFCCCSLVLDFCEVLHLFFEARDFIRHRCSAEPSKAWIHCQGPFSLSADLCRSRSLSGGTQGDE